MESFFGTLKTELVHHREYPDPRGANCSLISKATTIVRGSTPPSATSPHSRQRQKPHNPVSTFPGEGHSPASLAAKLRRQRPRIYAPEPMVVSA
jgi:hypothetical protein